ncbi:hypothetical protein EJ08DRAFT_695445 [Tothia fuscella]|uniref:Haloacid dehalogenase n=1 Tax=Tothia fuscella TaxID=1048955 RepID=A0A9P4NVE0_9PEZI|nr:hypothetical protein EJ08DRAFT_695445 [Tothia fuscella]
MLNPISSVPRVKKNLLLTFDAFGTLFTPRQPIAAQYGEVARRKGIINFTEKDLGRSFKQAFKNMSAAYPNYGRDKPSQKFVLAVKIMNSPSSFFSCEGNLSVSAVFRAEDSPGKAEPNTELLQDMSVATWWEELIIITFLPYSDHRTIESMVPELLHRFSSNEGYRLCSDAELFFQTLRASRELEKVSILDSASKGDPDLLSWLSLWDNIVVGVISNSDDRIATVLESSGVTVGASRFHTKTIDRNGNPDIDFVFTSYNARSEKPNPTMFQAAEDLSIASGIHPGLKIHIGDDYDKDVIGARDAGWVPMLLDREAAESVVLNPSTKSARHSNTDLGKIRLITSLVGLHSFSLEPQTVFYKKWRERD